jgi:hypothetical protein
MSKQNTVEEMFMHLVLQPNGKYKVVEAQALDKKSDTFVLRNSRQMARIVNRSKLVIK